MKRIIALILSTISISCFIGSLALTVINNMLPAENEYRNDLYKTMAYNYACEAVDKNNAKQLSTTTNMNISVSDTNYITGNTSENNSFSFCFFDSMSLEYATGTCWAAMDYNSESIEAVMDEMSYDYSKLSLEDENGAVLFFDINNGQIELISSPIAASDVVAILATNSDNEKIIFKGSNLRGFEANDGTRIEDYAFSDTWKSLNLIGKNEADSYCFTIKSCQLQKSYEGLKQVVITLPNELDYSKNDLFCQVDNYLRGFNILSSWALAGQLFFGILSFASVIYLFYSCGKKKNVEGIYLTWLDKVYFEVLSLIALLAIFGIWCLVAAFIDCFNQMSKLEYLIVILVEATLVSVFIVLEYLVSLITRLKAGKFWRYTIWHFIFSPVRKITDYWRAKTKLFTKVFFIIQGFFIAPIASRYFIYILTRRFYCSVFMTLWTLLIDFLLVYAAFCIVGQWEALRDGADNITKGNLEEKIDTTGMYPEFKRHGEDLNNVSIGIQNAVDQQLKSERFRTELITNVSHDIKTPLTSIINYVDLIKKEGVEDPTLCEYVEVLDRQSSRLKKLIEDLMEASKASTGNLAVNMETFDVTVMLTQTVGEFQEKLKSKDIDLVINCPEEEILINADGRHLWRIIDNLLNNVYKYAQPGTRAFVDVSRVDDKVRIVIKNTSANLLNITAEELMERFVRGDSSRNTEGSGLGLSIAKSLTELMNGSLSLNIDGDLFKATLDFPN